MQADGSYAAWTSPRGTPMRLAAAAPYIPWSDLVSALMPNGRLRDDRVAAERESREPLPWKRPVRPSTSPATRLGPPTTRPRACRRRRPAAGTRDVGPLADRLVLTIKRSAAAAANGEK